MGREIVSRFRQTPKTTIGRWAMWLGLSPFFTVPFLGIFASVIRPFIDNLTNESIGAAIGFSILLLYISLTITALTTVVFAYRKGERSWGIWVGLVPAIFLLLTLIGELIFSH
jgi:hypothetical protein